MDYLQTERPGDQRVEGLPHPREALADDQKRTVEPLGIDNAKLGKRGAGGVKERTAGGACGRR
jgi:hypothetical protein